MPFRYVPFLCRSQVRARLGEETDYNNFKSEVARHQGRPGAAYEHSLQEVWSLMFSDTSSPPPREGGSSDARTCRTEVGRHSIRRLNIETRREKSSLGHRRNTDAHGYHREAV